MAKALETQRTYALVGTGGCGKTTLAEMLLFQAGVINRLGKVEDGSTALDYEPEEIKRRGSIQPGFAQYLWDKNQHFCIDTPGDTNFTGDLPYLLLGADAAVFIIDAVDGVRPLTKRLWEEVRKAGLPSVCFLNKMDRDRADFAMAFDGLSTMLKAKPVLLYMPIGKQDQFTGLVDVLGNKALFFEADGKVKAGDIPADLADEVALMRETTVENIAESDEVLMEKYLEEGALSPEEITEAMRKGVLSGDLLPVVAGAALENKGGAQLLDVIQDLLPNPLERGAWTDEDGNERPSSPDEPLAAVVFKTLADPFAGQLSVVRVLSGTLTADTAVTNAANGETERIGQLLLLSGKDQKQSKEPLGPGGVAAIAKLKNTSTTDILCAEKKPFKLALPKLAANLITYALAPKEKGEEDKVYSAVGKLLEEDVNLKLSRDEESGDILLAGMGQLHIEMAVEKAKRRYKTEILLKTPKVPYRETIKGKADVQGRHKKQSGGRGQFGDCFIRMEPLPSGSGYEFEDAIVGGSIPRQYIPAVDKGIQEAAHRGSLAGCPVVDFKVTLYDGSYHNVDSSEMAFKIAGSIAFKKALEVARPILLEPIMLVTVTIPDENMGDIIGDLSSRRGKVLGSDSTAGVTEVKAHVPMNEILSYAQTLSSMTGGQGMFTMEFDHYEEAPPPVADKVIAENKKGEE
ncbi:MAG: elongation factor G [Desulfovibrionaceae bacterium]